VAIRASTATRAPPSLSFFMVVSPSSSLRFTQVSYLCNHVVL